LSEAVPPIDSGVAVTLWVGLTVGVVIDTVGLVVSPAQAFRRPAYSCRSGSRCAKGAVVDPDVIELAWKCSPYSALPTDPQRIGVLLVATGRGDRGDLRAVDIHADLRTVVGGRHMCPRFTTNGAARPLPGSKSRPQRRRSPALLPARRHEKVRF
jgi:hypothetical protein